jgi:hypothetical protein
MWTNVDPDTLSQAIALGFIFGGILGAIFGTSLNISERMRRNR